MLAASAWAGSWWVLAVPLWIGAVGVVIAFAIRRPWLLIAATALLAGALSTRAVAGLAPPVTGRWEGRATLLTDPSAVPGGLRVEARVAGKHLRLIARGPVVADLRDAWAGQPVWVRGRIAPMGVTTDASKVRHLAGRMEVREVVSLGGARPWWVAAHYIRTSVAALGEDLPIEQRALFLGFVLGDDRLQSSEVAADFQASGLTHLLVVSGENVALVLSLCGPALRKGGWVRRWLLHAVVLVGFALVTRFEPSVLRAVSMAAVAVTASAVGRPATGWRTLGLAVTGLLLIDPLLARSIGFALSVGASAGILAWARTLGRMAPGPGPVAGVLGVTGAAQLGVAPILLTRFGGIPVATLPANLLAAPAAAAVIVAGIPLLLVDKLCSLVGLGGPCRWPVQMMLGWVLTVARWSARLPLGRAGVAVVVLVALGALAAALAESRGKSRWARAAKVIVLLALLAPGAMVWSRSHTGAVAGGVEVHRAGGATVVVLVSDVEAAAALDVLADAGVGRIDLLVAEAGGARQAQVISQIAHRWPVRRTLAPRAHRIRGALTARTDQRWTVGSITVVVIDDSPRLKVRVSAT